jgi:hypothetical protein
MQPIAAIRDLTCNLGLMIDLSDLSLYDNGYHLQLTFGLYCYEFTF